MANKPAKAGSSSRTQAEPRTTAGHRAARAARAARDSGPSALGWVPYLIALAGAAAGLVMAWQGTRYAVRGTGLVGCSLLFAGLARLVLPPRLAGPLATRRKASDVLAFAVFGGGVLALALMLP